MATASSSVANVAERLAALASTDEEDAAKPLNGAAVTLLLRDVCALSVVDQARLLTDASELLERMVDATDEVQSALRTSKAGLEDVQQQVFSGCFLGRWYGRQYVEEVSVPGMADSMDEVTAAFKVTLAVLEAGPASTPAHRTMLLLVQASQKLGAARQELARCQRQIAAGNAILQRRTASWGCLA
jgi:hypothetical protein